jgi:hypothetical protein
MATAAVMSARARLAWLWKNGRSSVRITWLDGLSGND